MLLDLKIYSVNEPKIVVEQIQQELGSETITKDDLQRNFDGVNLLHSFQMSKIQEQNDMIRAKFLQHNPNGINMVRT